VGLTEREWQILEEISSEHFMPSMFARKCEQTPAAVSKVLRQLLDKELVRVSIAQNDGRQRAYELTPRGTSLMDALRAERERAIAAIWNDLPDEQLRSFNALSERLIARIEDYADKER
jgi:DNA-binding MarR family transcriptional regulator